MSTLIIRCGLSYMKIYCASWSAFAMNEVMNTTDYVVTLDGERLPPINKIGGKASGFARSLQLGVSVPPAFVITVDACKYFNQFEGQLPPGLIDACAQAIGYLEERTGRIF